MRTIIFLTLIILTAFLITGTANAADQIDTSNILIMAYYDTGLEIDLSQAIQEFDTVTESTGQYVEGTLRMFYDDPNGRNTGGLQEFEVRNSLTTNIPFYTDVNVRVKSDGWIVTWLDNGQNLGNDLVFWNDADTVSGLSDTTLSKAIWRITDRSGLYFNRNNVNYYSYTYPDANRLMIGGRVTSGSETYYFLIPSAITVYEAYLPWTVYLFEYSDYGASINIDSTSFYDKNYVNEYARYYHSIEGFSKDTRHMVYMESQSSIFILKSAVVILYRTV